MRVVFSYQKKKTSPKKKAVSFKRGPDEAQRRADSYSCEKRGDGAEKTQPTIEGKAHGKQKKRT